MGETWKEGWVIAHIAGMGTDSVLGVEYRATDKELHVKIPGLVNDARWDGDIFKSKLAALRQQLKYSELHTKSIMVQCKLEEMVENAPERIHLPRWGAYHPRRLPEGRRL